jgi:sodium/potassium-transporting ATPase subunit alpha
MEIALVELARRALPSHADTPRIDEIDRPLLFRAYAVLGGLEAIAAMATYFFVLHRGGWRFGDALSEGAVLYRQATTACLTAIVVTQVANVFLCRSERTSAFASLRNRLLVVGIGVEIVLILVVDYTPWGNALFGTAPLAASAWIFAVPFAGLMLLADELRKVWVRRYRFSGPHRTVSSATSAASTGA